MHRMSVVLSRASSVATENPSHQSACVVPRHIPSRVTIEGGKHDVATYVLGHLRVVVIPHPARRLSRVRRKPRCQNVFYFPLDVGGRIVNACSMLKDVRQRPSSTRTASLDYRSTQSLGQSPFALHLQIDEANSRN